MVDRARRRLGRHARRAAPARRQLDGSRLEPAFAYRWRMWTMPEIRDCLEEAGFSQVRIFWEYTAENGDAEYVEVATEQNQEIWLTYLVASP